MMFAPARRFAGGLIRRVRRPVVSVVMPCRDGGDFLEPAVRSVLNQDLRDVELIVVDDGSTDDSVAVISRLAARDRRLRLLRTAGGRGPGVARNLGIDAARGRYLAFADADDQVLPGAYSVMSQAIRHRGVDMVVGGYQRHSATARSRPRMVEEIHAEDRVAVTVAEWPQVLDEVVIWNRLFRTTFWRRHVGPFPEAENYEDREPSLRASLRARRLTVLTEDVYSWRLPEGRRTRSQQKDQLHDLDDRFAVARREVALVEEAPPVVRRQVWARLVGTDLGLFAVQIPTSGDDYWTRFSEVAGWLVQRAPRDVWSAVPVWERLLTHCAAARSRADLEELLGTRAEDSSAIPLAVEGTGALLADLDVVDRLESSVPPSLLAVAPSLLRAMAGVQRVRRVDGGDVSVEGYAYLTGVCPDAEGLTISVRSLGEEGAESLPLEPRPDDHVDVAAGDPWCSYRGGGFTLRFSPPEPQPGQIERQVVDLAVDISWRGERWSTPLSIPIPTHRSDETGRSISSSAGTPTRVRIHDVQVEGRAVVVVGRVDRVLDTLRIGIKTSALEFATDVALDQDRRFRAVLTTPDDRAFPSDGYFIRWAVNDGPLVGWARAGTRLREGSIESEGPVQRATARSHPDSTNVSVTIGPPLTTRERSRVGQHSLRATYRTDPIERGVLLETFNGKTCGDNPGAIAAGLREAGIDLPIYWSVQDLSIPTPPGGIPLVVGSAEWHQVLTTAKVLVNNNNFPHWFEKRPGQFYLQTWHGTPIKRLLWDLPPERVPLTYRRLMRRQVPMWDLLLAQTEEAAKHLRSGLGYGGDVLVVEQPRNAVLAEGRRGRRRVRERLGIHPDEQVVLYAPTWREPHRTALRAAHWGDVLDAERLATATDSRVMLRSHHMSRRGPVASEQVVDVTSYQSLEELMLAADVLISDYSSILHDWALLKRPAVLFTPDLAYYRDAERGFYGDWPASMPWPMTGDEEELRGLVRDALAVGAPHRWPSSERSVADGCRRVVDCVVGLLDGADQGSAKLDVGRLL